MQCQRGHTEKTAPGGGKEIRDRTKREKVLVAKYSYYRQGNSKGATEHRVCRGGKKGRKKGVNRGKKNVNTCMNRGRGLDSRGGM